jgi:hypothetical protein
MPCPPPWDGRSATCDRRGAQATRARQPGLEGAAANFGTRDGRAWKPHPRTCRGRRSKAGSPGGRGTRARLARDPRPPVKRGGSVIHVMELEGPNSQLPPPSVGVRGCQATIARLPDVEGPSAKSGRLACQGWRSRHPTLEFAPANVEGHACWGTSIRPPSLGGPRASLASRGTQPIHGRDPLHGDRGPALDDEPRHGRSPPVKARGARARLVRRVRRASVRHEPGRRVGGDPERNACCAIERSSSSLRRVAGASRRSSCRLQNARRACRRARERSAGRCRGPGPDSRLSTFRPVVLCGRGRR